jgi:hypothetical protein
MECHAELAQFGKLLPRWLRTHRAVNYSGLSEVALFQLWKDGRIEAALVNWRHTKRRLRVYDRLSIDRYLESQAEIEVEARN